MFIYESHMDGGIYLSDHAIDDKDLYCEICGDSDTLIGEFTSATDFLKVQADEIDANDGHGGYDINYILTELHPLGDVPTIEEAIKIVYENSESRQIVFCKDCRFHSEGDCPYKEGCQLYNHSEGLPLFECTFYYEQP